MKLTKFLFLFIALPGAGFSQIQGEDEVYLNGDRIEAKFNGGGIDKFSEFVNKEFDYSKVTKPGKMVGAFTIDIEGNVKNIKIIEFFDVESATEFIRVLKKCPKWESAKRGGKPISIDIKYPMVFNRKPMPESSIAKNPSENESDKGMIFNTAGVEKKPEFPGGVKEFYKYIAQNFKTPDVKGLAGKVIVTFVVEKDGSITDIKVLRDIGYGSAEEAVRVLKNSPNWIPAEQDGKKVRVLYSLPISIQPSK